jgi:DNA modification methylase
VGRHPNEKPMELCTKLVGLFSDPGELVFDPFAGSGAIGEACLRLGRCYLGWERDPTWAAKARARVTRAIYAPVSVAGLREICSMR